jgi:hypothetical protein
MAAVGMSGIRIKKGHELCTAPPGNFPGLWELAFSGKHTGCCPSRWTDCRMTGGVFLMDRKLEELYDGFSWANVSTLKMHFDFISRSILANLNRCSI